LLTRHCTETVDTDIELSNYDSIYFFSKNRIDLQHEQPQQLGVRRSHCLISETMNAQDVEDGMDLLFACEDGNIRRMRSLVSRGASVDFQGVNGLTPSICCCFYGGFPRILQYLIDRGADTNRANINGYTAVYVAAQLNNLQCMSLLIHNGAYVNKADIDGCTPLYAAAEFNSHQCVSLLLLNGADADRATDDGSTPLHKVAQKNHHQCLSLLLKHGADTGRVNSYGYTALHFAAQFDSYECVSQLLNHGVSVEAINEDRQTALMLASFYGYMSVVELLVEEGGSEFEIADIDGNTARDMARQEGHHEIVMYLSIEINWRRRRNYATMLGSILGAPTDSKMMKVFQCHDVARVIMSYV
jgi:ankyrin repeat protein